MLYALGAGQAGLLPSLGFSPNEKAGERALVESLTARSAGVLCTFYTTALAAALMFAINMIMYKTKILEISIVIIRQLSQTPILQYQPNLRMNWI